MKRFKIKIDGQEYTGLFRSSFDAFRDAQKRFGTIPHRVSIILEQTPCAA